MIFEIFNLDLLNLINIKIGNIIKYVMMVWLIIIKYVK